jgi:hypothetical protein
MAEIPKLAREHPPASERLIAPVRAYGIRSFAWAVTAVGVIAGVLAGAGIERPLWEWIALVGIAFVIALLGFTFSHPRFKFALASLIYRRPVARDEQRRPRWGPIYGTTPRGSVLQVAAARKIDRVYEGGFRSLLDARDPIAVVATTPRDVSDVTKLPAGMFNRGGSRTECIVDPTTAGIPLEPYMFEREPAEGAQDIDHMLAVRDVMYLANLAHALRGRDDNWGAAGKAFIWPEHCVDMSFLAAHDVCIVGGGDTNFWHGALFEQVHRSFQTPPSTIPLALDLREGGTPFYTSRTINTRLSDSNRIPGLEKSRRMEVDERRFPTAAVILACENPFARALGRDHWCVFLAGTRSLGTAGAVLALSTMIERLRADGELNYFSAVDTAQPDVRALVSALLVRAVTVEYAAEDNRGRGRRPIPTDRPDPEYRDSYVPTAVEYLDNTGEAPEWRALVSLDAPRDEVDAARAPRGAERVNA